MIKKTKVLVGIMFFLTVVLFASNAVFAVSTEWIGGTGDWSVASNWDNGVPSTGVDATIENGGTVTVTGAESVDMIKVGDGSTLSVTGGLTAIEIRIGTGTTAGTGTLTSGLGSSVIVSGPLYVGYAAGSTATLNQSGDITYDQLNIGINASTDGTLNLLSGTLTAEGDTNIGGAASVQGELAVSGGLFYTIGFDTIIYSNGALDHSGGTMTLGELVVRGRYDVNVDSLRVDFIEVWDGIVDVAAGVTFAIGVANTMQLSGATAPGEITGAGILKIDGELDSSGGGGIISVDTLNVDNGKITSRDDTLLINSSTVSGTNTTGIAGFYPEEAGMIIAPEKYVSTTGSTYKFLDEDATQDMVGSAYIKPIGLTATGTVTYTIISPNGSYPTWVGEGDYKDITDVFKIDDPGMAFSSLDIRYISSYNSSITLQDVAVFKNDGLGWGKLYTSGTYDTYGFTKYDFSTGSFAPSSYFVLAHTPEPSTFILFFLGFMGLGLGWWRRRRR